MTTAAQNIHVFLRKSPLCRNHFFGWSKTANSSTAYGTVTLKSPPSRGSDAPHVHSRLRKHLSRCTLDCGSKTSESPALRGFVGGPQALATAALYLVLKSNGPHRSKNLPVKFGFSSKTVPTNIAKKLPPQRCFKPLLIAIFNFSHKRPAFAFAGESGYTLGFRRRIAHSGSHGETGAFPPSSTAGLCAASEIALSAAFVTLIPQRFYIHTFPGSLWPPLSATALPQTIFHRVFQLLPQTARVCFRRQKWVHTRPCSKNRTQRPTRRNTGRFGWGWYHYPRSVPHVSETLRGRGLKRQTLPLLGLGRGCSQRTQRAFGTAMRLCASLSRGVAAPLGCVIFSVSVEIAACMPCAQGLSVCARRRVVSLPSARFTCC